MVCEAGENIIAVASGANAELRADQVPDELLGPGTVLVAQMEVPVAQTAAVVRRVRARGGTSLLNLAPALPIDHGLMRLQPPASPASPAARKPRCPMPRRSMRR